MLKIRGRTWWQKNCKNWSNSRTIEKWNHDSWSEIHFGESPVEKKLTMMVCKRSGCTSLKHSSSSGHFQSWSTLETRVSWGKMKSNNINTNSDVTTYLSNKVTCNWLMFSWVSHTWGWVKVFCWIKLSKNRGQCPVRNLVGGGKQKIPINREYWNYFIRKYE